jgi:hypothetical protein
MQLNQKETLMLRHYSKLLDEFLFDEYDILGFLMLIRERIRKEKTYPCILEFSDLIAHYERDRGLVFDAIKTAIDNGYKTTDGKRIIDYKGIDETTWISEWDGLLTELNISVNKRLLDEITICICSLANGSSYYNEKSRHSGIMYLGFSENKIALVTTEGERNSLHITFFVYSGISLNVDRKYDFGKWIGETVRENGSLRMRDKSGDYIF